MLRKVALVTVLLTLTACAQGQEKYRYSSERKVEVSSTNPSGNDNRATMEFRENLSAFSRQTPSSGCERPNLQRDGICYQYDPTNRERPRYSRKDVENLEAGCQVNIEGWYFKPGGGKTYARDWDCSMVRGQIVEPVPDVRYHNEVEERYQVITCDPVPLSREPHARPASGWKPFARTLKSRTRQEVLSVYTTNSKESRVSAAQMRSIASSITGLCWSSAKEFEAFFMSPDVEEVTCTPELLTKLNMGRTDATGGVIDYDYSRTACHAGEVLYRWNGIYFISNTCLNPTPPRVAITKYGMLGTPSSHNSFVSVVLFH